MIKIENLNQLLKPLTKRDEQAGLVPTLKDIMVESVGRKKPSGMKQALGYYKLANKILESKDIVELADIEHDVIKEAMEENPSGYFPFYLSQAWEKVNGAKS